MLKKIMRFISTVLGGIIGYQVAGAFNYDFADYTYYGVIIGGAIVGLVVIPFIIEKLLQLISKVESSLQNVPFSDIIAGTLGAIAGLIFGILLSYAFPISNMVDFGSSVQVIINLILAYLGLTITLKKKEDLFNLFSKIPGSNKVKRKENSATPKILDTSVIIDGRISDICKTNFVEGTLIIPEFVLEELRHIADSPDLLKRNRGRRGLDILNDMQKQLDLDVEIVDDNPEEIEEVDSKLVKLAKMMGGMIITNDFNLNKVAELHGVPVLNINELSNALKPIVLPGEEMEVKVIKEGKEYGQGVAYLDDGTMIVVDNGKNHIGEKIAVMVTSILQTAAGRMIFAKPKAMKQAL